MIIWWSKHVGVILSVLMCDIWINVLLQTSALVGPLYVVPGYTFYCINKNNFNENYMNIIKYEAPYYMIF
jgi:hypothetical protein